MVTRIGLGLILGVIVVGFVLLGLFQYFENNALSNQVTREVVILKVTPTPVVTVVPTVIPTATPTAALKVVHPLTK